MTDEHHDDKPPVQSWKGHPAAHGEPQHHAVPLNVVSSRAGSRRHCWEIIQSPDNDLHGTCEECYAYFVQQDCWTLWGLREAGQKPCCQKRENCATCPVLLQQVAPQRDDTVQMRAQMPSKPANRGSAKQVCHYLEAADVPVSPENDQYLSAISRAVQGRYSAFHCRLRGVHLDLGYVSDMCVSRHIEDCVFLEEAHPEVMVHTVDGYEETMGKVPYDEDHGEYTASSRLHKKD